MTSGGEDDETGLFLDDSMSITRWMISGTTISIAVSENRKRTDNAIWG